VTGAELMELAKKLADFADDFAPWGFDAVH
jgi:hypothetical protein